MTICSDPSTDAASQKTKKTNNNQNIITPKEKQTALRPLYAVAAHQAIASGDLAKMKAVAKQAQQHLADHGDVSAALEALKIEIAKLAARKA